MTAIERLTGQGKQVILRPNFRRILGSDF